MEDQITATITGPWPRLQTIHCHHSVCHLISLAQRRVPTMQIFKAFLLQVIQLCLWIHCQISFTRSSMGCNTCPQYHLISQWQLLLIIKLVSIIMNFQCHIIINIYPQTSSLTRCSILKVMLPMILQIFLWYIPTIIQVSRNRYHPTWPMRLHQAAHAPGQIHLITSITKVTIGISIHSNSRTIKGCKTHNLSNNLQQLMLANSQGQ